MGLVGDGVKVTVGDGVIVAVGDRVAVAVGEAVGDGVAVAGIGEGEAVGLACGEGDGVSVAVGSTLGVAVARNQVHRTPPQSKSAAKQIASRVFFMSPQQVTGMFTLYRSR